MLRDDEMTIAANIQSSLKRGVAESITKLLREHTNPCVGVDSSTYATSNASTLKRRIPGTQQSAAKRRAVCEDKSNSSDVVVSELLNLLCSFICIIYLL